MSAEGVLREYAGRTGWDLAAMLAVATGHIDGLRNGSDTGNNRNADTSGNAGSDGGAEGFRAYVRGRAEDEIAMSDD